MGLSNSSTTATEQKEAEPPMRPPKSVAVLGGGPCGTEMATALLAEFGSDPEFQVTLIERGANLADNVRNWGHVKLFSPWSLNTSTYGRAVLKERGCPPPEDETVFPTGKELREQYLLRLQEYLQEHKQCNVMLNTRVVKVARGPMNKGDKIGQRKNSLFNVLVDNTAEGKEDYVKAEAVIDCTGTYGNGNWLGRGGLPALGERRMESNILRVIPDPLGGDRDTYANKVTTVVGSGYSAITTVKALVDLAAEEGNEATRIKWITRRPTNPYTIIEDDPLPMRAKLAEFGNDLAAAKNPQVEYVGGYDIVRITEVEGQTAILLNAREGSGHEVEAKEILCDNLCSLVGYRPDMEMQRELQVHMCYATEGPMKLAAAMLAAGGGGGDCMKQVAPGPATLVSPETGFYTIGMKSYGRGSAYLIRIGNEQIPMIISLLQKGIVTLPEAAPAGEIVV